MTAPGAVTLIPLTGIPEITTGSDLAAELAAAAARAGGLRPGDVLAVSSKVVSKAGGLRTPADDGPDARRAAVDRHTVRVVAERLTATGTTRIVRSLAGPVMAAAGVDASNTGPEGGVLLLPEDPDAAAADLHTALTDRFPGIGFGVVLTDTAGRPWRAGQTDLALGAHGVRVIDDLRGGVDADGRALGVTERAVADEIAAAADLVKGKADGVPAAIVRGTGLVGPGAGARSLVRTGAGDWFALGRVEAVRAALGAAPGSAEAARVGVPPVPPDPGGAAGRAVALALLGHEGARIEADPSTPGRYVVRSPDPVLAGRVAARLEVALAAEAPLTGEPCAPGVSDGPGGNERPAVVIEVDLSGGRSAGASAAPHADPDGDAAPR